MSCIWVTCFKSNERIYEGRIVFSLYRESQFVDAQGRYRLSLMVLSTET